ncbi:MAG: S8 family serine peptidase [Dongiaceae bacterium]
MRDGGSDRRVVSAELVVADPTPGFGRAVARLGFAVLEQRSLPALRLTVARLRLPTGVTETAGRRLLQQRFPAIIADYNDLFRPSGTTSLPAPDYPRRLIGWGSPDAGCGRGRTIGMIDTAIDAGLPAFAAAAIAQRSFVPAGLQAAAPDHGTAVAGILVATRRAGHGGGLLPGAALRGAAVFHRDGAGPPAADALAFALALDWLAGERVEVINLSLAGPDNAVIRLAVARAVARGLLLVAAAGPDGPAAPPAFPAAYPGVLAAAAVDAQRRPDPAGNRGDYVAFAAPGRQVWAPAPAGELSVSGSSFAAPFVAAALAATLGDGPVDRPALERRLAASAVDLGAPGRDPVFGWGLIQARAPCSQSASR